MRAEHEPVPAVPTPADEAVSGAERAEVLAALNTLDERDRLVIALRYFEQLHEAEMAIVLDCAPGTELLTVAAAVTLSDAFSKSALKAVVPPLTDTLTPMSPLLPLV